MYQLPKYPYSYSLKAPEFYLRVCFPCEYLQMTYVRHLKRSYYEYYHVKEAIPKCKCLCLLDWFKKKFSLKYFNMKEKSKKVWKSNYLPSPCFLKKVINISFNPLNFFSLELECHLEICNAVFKNKFFFWINQPGPATRDSLKTS